MCSAANSRKVFVIPGNGSGDILAANWYKWVRDQVNKTGVECVVKNMPDPGFLFVDLILDYSVAEEIERARASESFVRVCYSKLAGDFFELETSNTTKGS